VHLLFPSLGPHISNPSRKNFFCSLLHILQWDGYHIVNKITVGNITIASCWIIHMIILNSLQNWTTVRYSWTSYPLCMVNEPIIFLSICTCYIHNFFFVVVEISYLIRNVRLYIRCPCTPLFSADNCGTIFKMKNREHITTMAHKKVIILYLQNLVVDNIV